METFSGESNWNLTVRRDADGVTLLRCATCDRRAVLPESLWGLPVVALGPHALTPQAAAVDGEAVRITCGPGGAAWDNQDLRELSLPAPLRRVGDYALYNCRTLSRLRLHDGVTRWGSGVLMNCRELDTVEIEQPHGDGGSVACLTGELNRELNVIVTRGGEVAFRLVFPEYRELYEENCPAHHFDYTIEGAGYPYRHCFRQRKLDLSEYDSLWPKHRGMAAGTALRLAWWRLRYPEGLTGRFAEAYRAYLRAHTKEAAAWLIAERDVSGLAFLLREAAPDREALTFAASLARETSLPEALALLLEEQRRRFPVPDAARFAL